MPYINSESRDKYKNLKSIINKTEIDTKGDLEYLVFSLMVQFMVTRQFKYSDLHDCVYAVEHCSHEFLRRFLDKREDSARHENGDIN